MEETLDVHGPKVDISKSQPLVTESKHVEQWGRKLATALIPKPGNAFSFYFSLLFSGLYCKHFNKPSYILFSSPPSKNSTQIYSFTLQRLDKTTIQSLSFDSILPSNFGYYSSSRILEVGPVLVSQSLRTL